MAFIAGIDKRLIGAPPKPIEPSTARTLRECVCRGMSLMLLVALCAVSIRNRFVGVGSHSIESSTSLTLVKSVDWLLVILLVVALAAERHKGHQQQ